MVNEYAHILELYAYDPYGRPLIRESCGRGDMDDDGDVHETDLDLYDTKQFNWPPFASPTVKHAFSDVNNPFMFQGRPRFAFDTEASATEGVLMLNDHRARMNDPVTGRWNTKDPLFYNLPLLLTSELSIGFHSAGSNNLEPRRLDAGPSLPAIGEVGEIVAVCINT